MQLSLIQKQLAEEEANCNLLKMRLQESNAKIEILEKLVLAERDNNAQLQNTLELVQTNAVEVMAVLPKLCETLSSIQLRRSAEILPETVSEDLFGIQTYHSLHLH